MRALTKSLGFLAILGTATMLHADDAAPVTPAPGAGSAAAAATPQSMSPAEMQAHAADILSQANIAYHEVLSLHERAKKAQDVIKLNCVNNKLVQVKAQLNIADNENQDLEVAISKNSADRFGAYANLDSTGKSIAQLRDDARACIGEIELYKGESGVTVTHPQFPDQPTPIDPFQGEVEPPAYASPFI